MANRYWVGGSGNWNDSNHWATSTGGTPGASIPTSSDNVYFDANSFTLANDSVNINTSASCLSMNWTGATNNPRLIGSSNLFIYGSLTLISIMTSTHSGGFNFLSTSTGHTVDTAGISLANSVISFNGVGGGWTVQSHITSTGYISLANGTVDMNDKNFTGSYMYSTGSGAKNWYLGNGTYTLSNNFGVTLDTATNLNLYREGSTITLTGSAASFKGGNNIFNNVNLTGAVTTMTGSNTFANLTVAPGKTLNVTAGTTQTIENSMGNGTSGNLVTLQSTVSGSYFSLQSGTDIVVDYYSIKDSHIIGSGVFTATNSTNVSGNLGWVFANPPMYGNGSAVCTSLSVVAARIAIIPNVNVSADSLIFGTSRLAIIGNVELTGTSTATSTLMRQEYAVTSVSTTSATSSTGVIYKLSSVNIVGTIDSTGSVTYTAHASANVVGTAIGEAQGTKQTAGTIAITIDNEPVRISPNWRISDKINARTTAQLTVVDMLNLSDIDIGDNIVIREFPNVIFAGTVESVDEYEPYPGYVERSVSAVDFSALADKKIIADSVVDTPAGDIINDSILPLLAPEGVVAGDIQDADTVKKAVFNYITCAEALDKLTDITGLNWNIDFDRKLNFFAKDTNVSPFTLDDTVQHFGFTRNKTRNQYRNRQYVRAGQGKTNTQTLENPTPKPDGTSRNFIVRFPVAERPRIFINTVEVNPSDIGVNGLDKNKKFYFSYGSNVITQDESQPVLISTDAIQITYTGLFPILVVADNPLEISSRQLKEEGTSGVYEQVIKEYSINQVDQALEYAQGLLVKYGVIPSTVSFETNVSGLKAGQLLNINKPLYGIRDSFLIESIDISTDGHHIVRSVKCLDGSALGGWEQFFKEILKGNREFVIAETEVLILLNSQRENVGYESEVTITSFECLYPSDTLYPNDTLFPGIKTGEVIVND